MIYESLPEGDSISPDVGNYKKIFTNDIVGILLFQRGEQDRHVCFRIICEDDGNWFPISYNQTSTHWLRKYKELFLYVEEWLETHCFTDESGFGYKFP